MSAVDVLAVLDWFAYPEARPEIGTVARATKGKSIDDLRQARAAVAEVYAQRDAYAELLRQRRRDRRRNR